MTDLFTIVDAIRVRVCCVQRRVGWNKTKAIVGPTRVGRGIGLLFQLHSFGGRPQYDCFTPTPSTSAIFLKFSQL